MKHLFLTICLAWASVLAVAAQNAAAVAQSIADDAEAYLGTPYKKGAEGPRAFDAASFTRYVYAANDISLPATIAEQFQTGESVASVAALQKGDLVFFAGKSGTTPEIVGVLISVSSDASSFSFVHAAKGGVQIGSYSALKSRFLGARRLLSSTAVGLPSQRAEEAATAEPVGKAVPQTLTLDSADRRILLFEDGTWAYVSDSGTLVKPSSSEKILLTTEGNWGVVRTAQVDVPASTPAASQSASSSKSSAATSSSSSKQWHTIKSGDTLYALSRKYGTTVKAICSLNGIKESTTLKVGQKLRVK